MPAKVVADPLNDAGTAALIVASFTVPLVAGSVALVRARSASRTLLSLAVIAGAMATGLVAWLIFVDLPGVVPIRNPERGCFACFVAGTWVGFFVLLLTSRGLGRPLPNTTSPTPSSTDSGPERAAPPE